MTIKQQAKTQWYDHILPAYNIDGKANYLNDKGELIEGIYDGVENDVYHSLDAYSSSLIKELVKSTPAHAFRHYFSEIKRTRTLTQARTLDTGTLGHEVILEPQGFYERYFKLPHAHDHTDALFTTQQMAKKCKELNLKISGSKKELTKRLIEHDKNIKIFEHIIEQTLLKNAGISAFNAATTAVEKKQASSLLRAFELEEITKLATKNPVDSVIWDDIMRILDTFSKHARAPRLINDGFAELAVFARCPKTGLMLKCKFDYINKQAIASDVKTTRSADPKNFTYQCKDLRYDVQESFYRYVGNLAGIPVKLFAFIAIEFNQADICEVYEFSKIRQHKAHQDMLKGLDTLVDCLNSQHWYGYTKNDEIMVINW